MLARARVAAGVGRGGRRMCSGRVALQPLISRRVAALASRYDELQRENDASGFSGVRAKEMARIAPVLEAHTRMDEALAEAEGLRELATDASSEPELRDLARQELEQSEASLDEQHEAILTMLTPTEEEEEASSVLVEVQAGVGGIEAALFAQELFVMYERYARRRRWRWTLLSSSTSDLGGLREASASIAGEGAYAALLGENGTHRVQRVPATESLGRVHTSTATVLVMAEVERADVELRKDDIHVDVFRASGAGGQHVNTTESAVRLTHVPTGIKVSCQAERSQHQNRASAMKLLAIKLSAHAAAQADAARDEFRGANLGTGARSERIRTYNFADDRVSDHRLPTTRYGLDRMLEGEMLDEISAELADARRQRRRDELLAELRSDLPAT